MIDTVVLSIPKNMFTVLRPELFQPNCEPLLNYQNYRGRGLVKAIQNPSKQDVVEKNYKPRLTLENRPSKFGRSVTLRVEFSAPKLLWGNNFDELNGSDFLNVSLTLISKLGSMGVVVTLGQLWNVPVSAIHYSKNIILDDFTSVSMILDEIYKTDISYRLDSNTKDYRNEGHCIKFHANSHEIVFYDKLKDLEQASISEKRSIEKHNDCQMDIFQVLDKIKKPFEVLRMEIRLGNRQKIRHLLKSLAVDKELTFANLFNISLAKKVLKYYWEKIDDGIAFFQINAKSPIDLIEAIKKRHPNIKYGQLLKILGLITLIQEVGVRRTRGVLGFTKNGSCGWYRLKKDLKEINDLKTMDKYHSISKISHALNEFTPLRLSDYELNLNKM